MISVLCYIFTATLTPYVTQTIHCVLCWLQHICQILIYSEAKPATSNSVAVACGATSLVA